MAPRPERSRTRRPSPGASRSTSRSPPAPAGLTNAGLEADQLLPLGRGADEDEHALGRGLHPAPPQLVRAPGAHPIVDGAYTVLWTVVLSPAAARASPEDADRPGQNQAEADREQRHEERDDDHDQCPDHGGVEHPEGAEQHGEQDRQADALALLDGDGGDSGFVGHWVLHERCEGSAEVAIEDAAAGHGAQPSGRYSSLARNHNVSPTALERSRGQIRNGALVQVRGHEPSIGRGPWPGPTIRRWRHRSIRWRPRNPRRRPSLLAG